MTESTVPAPRSGDKRVEVSRALRSQMLAGPQARRIGGTRSEVKTVTQTGGASHD